MLALPEAVRGVVEAGLPGYRVDSVVRLGQGLDHVAYEVNNELVVRFGKASDPARVDREARLLTAVAGISPVPVPEPAFTVAELGCLAYFKISGVPLLDVPRSRWLVHVPSIAATLGELLAALHAAPVDRLADLVYPDDQPLVEWRREAAGTFPTVAERVPVARRRSVDAFLASPPPDDGYALVFSHNDLGIEHVLVDPARWRVTGVIDWSDAAIVDPARDYGLLYRDLGPVALELPDAVSLRERTVFYARCGVLEDLAYGVGTGQETYVDKSLAALDWLF